LTYTLDPHALRVYLEAECVRDPRTRRVVNKRTNSPVTAVIPVHLYGQTADMDPILELADEYDLIVIEDACQAHGAEYLSRKNGRLDAVQAGILRSKLRYLAKWNEQRRECARVYDELLADGAAAVTVPHVPAWSKPVYHLYVVRTGSRDDLQRHLADAGIGTGIHYPVPLHLQLAYARSGWNRGDFPVSEEAATEILS